MFKKKPNAPTEPCKITLSVNQIQPYKHNPRKAEHKKKDKLKLSIRKRGFKGELAVTLRPGADTYELSYGANTTYVVIKELWDETQDPRFERIPCSFEPWEKESTLLIDSLVENDARDNLIFINKACGLMQAWKALESESGETLSQRELSRQVHEAGGSFSQPLISQLEYAAETLLPLLPITLGEGLGRPRVIQLRKLHSAARKTWESLKEGEIDVFESLYAKALATTDTHEWDFDHTLRVVGDALSEPTGKSAASISTQILLILEERPGKD
jgi:ParB family protein of integrating conjugative element (PFGI_1 class)